MQGSPLPSALAVRAPYSGCGLPLCSEVHPLLLKVLLRRSTRDGQKTKFLRRTGLLYSGGTEKALDRRSVRRISDPDIPWADSIWWLPSILQTPSGPTDFLMNQRTPLIVGIILALVFALCIFGGSRQISRITEVLVPFMGIFYLLVSLFVIVTHYTLIPKMFSDIFSNAFDFQAIFGGFAGSCIMHGITKRTVFKRSRCRFRSECRGKCCSFPSGQTGTCSDAVGIYRHPPDLFCYIFYAAVLRRGAQR